MSWPSNNRNTDLIIIAFYVLALLVIWLIEIEQLIIADPASFEYPAWPPHKLIDLTHWWGLNYHSGLYHRPAWYQATIWADVFISTPVYIFGIYAFRKKKAWIKYPAIIQASMLAIIVLISMYDELFGQLAGQSKTVVILSMSIWLIAPLVIIRRAIQIKD